MKTQEGQKRKESITPCRKGFCTIIGYLSDSDEGTNPELPREHMDKSVLDTQFQWEFQTRQ